APDGAHACRETTRLVPLLTTDLPVLHSPERLQLLPGQRQCRLPLNAREQLDVHGRDDRVRQLQPDEFFGPSTSVFLGELGERGSGPGIPVSDQDRGVENDPHGSPGRGYSAATGEAMRATIESHSWAKSRSRPAMSRAASRRIAEQKTSILTPGESRTVPRTGTDCSSIPARSSSATPAS